MTHHEAIGLRRMPPLSARRPPPALPPLLADVVAYGDRVLAEPFVGITAGAHPQPGLFPIRPTGVSTAPMVDAALAFLDSLDGAQRVTGTFPIDADEFRRWCNVHIYLMRHGLLLEDLTEPQRAAALELVRASLSARGFGDVRDVMRFNEVLAEITGSVEEYGEWLYFLSIFGTPSPTELWGWQLDGQRRLLRQLVETYVGRMGDGHARVTMADIDRHLDETHFCWMGATNDVNPFYYKVQSPVVLIEFDHEPGVVFEDDEPTRRHVHTVVRTPNGNDYGIDLLRQHYERSPH